MIPLSELVSKLVVDCVNGARAAETTAASDRRELMDYLRQSPTEAPSESEIDSFLREQFPPLERPPTTLLRRAGDDSDVSWTPGETAVRAGNVYVHPDFTDFEHATEFPPIERTLGVRPNRDDLRISNGVAVQTEASVQHVRETVADHLGTHRQSVIRQAFEDGVPVPRVRSLDAEVPVQFTEDFEVEAVPSGSDSAPVGRLSLEMEFKQK